MVAPVCCQAVNSEMFGRRQMAHLPRAASFPGVLGFLPQQMLRLLRHPPGEDGATGQPLLRARLAARGHGKFREVGLVARRGGGPTRTPAVYKFLLGGGRSGDRQVFRVHQPR